MPTFKINNIYVPVMIKKLIFLLLLSLSIPATSGPADKLDMTQYKGKVVYVDFWASWCIPCKKSFPWMNAMHQKYQRLGLEIVAVNLDENPADADKFLAAHPAKFTIIRDPKGKLAQQYKVQGMPTALIFSADGKLVDQHIGFNPKDSQKSERLLRKLLARS